MSDIEIFHLVDKDVDSTPGVSVGYSAFADDLEHRGLLFEGSGIGVFNWRKVPITLIDNVRDSSDSEDPEAL